MGGFPGDGCLSRPQPGDADHQPAHAGGALERAEEALRGDRDRCGGDTAQRRAGGELLDAADPAALHRAEGEHGGDVAQQVRPLGERQPLLLGIQGARVGSQLPAAVQQPPLLLLSRPARHVPDARRVQGEVVRDLIIEIRILEDKKKKTMLNIY